MAVGHSQFDRACGYKMAACDSVCRTALQHGLVDGQSVPFKLEVDNENTRRKRWLVFSLVHSC